MSWLKLFTRKKSKKSKRPKERPSGVIIKTVDPRIIDKIEEGARIYYAERGEKIP